MPSNARILFSNDLIDLNQPASLKVIETEGKFQLCLIFGINAQKVTAGEPGDRDTCRDSKINTELFLTGRANIGLKKKGGPTNDTSIVSVAFDGDISTKVPGTGPDFKLLKFNFDEDALDFAPKLEADKV